MIDETEIHDRPASDADALFRLCEEQAKEIKRLQMEKAECTNCEKCGKAKIKDDEFCLCADEMDMEIARVLALAKKGDEKCWTCGGTGRSDERLPIHEENDRLKSALIDAEKRAADAEAIMRSRRKEDKP